ncbi:MAG TPA: hypothetical protein VNC50_12245, partial [Planctomycetia bacterium]|nr:hypothetical protein [Planctomycetia bacterium]
PGAAAMPAIPSAAAPTSTFVTPPGAVPPATAYPGAGATYPGSAYPLSPVTPSAPPAVGTYPPQAKGDAIGVPSDSQSMRFAAATLASATATAAAASESAAQPAQFRTPIQSMVPSSAAPNQAGVQRAFTPNAGLPGPQQTVPTSGVIPAEFQTPVGTVKATAANGGAPPGQSAELASASSVDGFRAQGSEPRTDSSASNSGNAEFRPPSAGKQATAADSATGRFGVGPKQEWLRGQLEFHPDGRWAINYMDEGPKDQIGGRVLIDNPQVLANLSPGEFVAVEGQLFGHQIDEASYQPVYRISSIQRQRQ